MKNRIAGDVFQVDNGGMIVAFRKNFLAVCWFVFSMASVAMAQSAPDLTVGTNRYTVYTNSQYYVGGQFFTYNLGPTGLRGWIYPLGPNLLDQFTSIAPWQILVTSVGTNTPAVGLLQTNDIILGVAAGLPPAPLFTNDSRIALGNAITAAEAGNGNLSFLVNRYGVATNMNLTIQLGMTNMVYSATAPYNCPKSALILSNALNVIKNNVGGSQALALLASGNTNYLPQVQSYARSIASTNLVLGWPTYQGVGGGIDTWTMGYNGLLLAEYYMVTHDSQVTNALTQYIVGLAKSDTMWGCYGHGGAKVMPYHVAAGVHGYGSGYGPVNACGLLCKLAMAVAQKTGIPGIVNNPEFQPSLNRSINFYGYYVQKGMVPYGEMPPYWDNYHPVGKDGLAALFFGVLSNQPTQAQYFTRMSLASYNSRETGHNGSGWGLCWDTLGTVMGGTNAAAAFSSNARWQLELARRCDGSFAYDCTSDTISTTSDYWGNENYQGFLDPTAWNALFLSAPNQAIYITGKNANPANFLTDAAVSNAVWAGQWLLNVASYTTNQLIANLSEYQPSVRHAAAQQLGSLCATNAALSSALAPTLIALTTNSNPWVREAACDALGAMKNTNALNALAARMYDSDVWVRFNANNALDQLGTAALPQLTNILTAFITYASPDPLVSINWNDPCGWGNGYLAHLLFNTLATNTIVQSTNLLYPAVSAGLVGQPDRLQQSQIGSFLKNQLRWQDVQAVAPALMAAGSKLAQADEMWDGAEADVLACLAKFGVPEGLAALAVTTDSGITFDGASRLTQAYQTYGTQASQLLPTLYNMETTGQSNGCAGLIVALQSNVKNLPAVNSLAQFSVASATPSAIGIAAATNVVLNVAASDLSGWSQQYSWSVAQGPGTVSFSNPTNASCTAAFSAPGVYILQVAAAPIMDRSLFWDPTIPGAMFMWGEPTWTFSTWTNFYGATYTNVMVTVLGNPSVNNAGGAIKQTASSATLQGLLTAGGGANAWICWGTQDAGTKSTNAWDAVQAVGTVSEGTVFSTKVVGLATNKTYFYRCFVTNVTGRAWSASATSFSAVPANGGSGYNMPISFTNYNRAETLTNFPALVVLSNGMAGGTFDSSTFLTTNGYDLRFTDSTGLTNLNYEIESWSGTSANVWVQIPRFNSNCSIWAKWGSALQTNQPAYTTNGATWDGTFKGVWHFPLGATLTALDSTTNGNNGTVVSATATSGVIGGGMNAATGAQYVDLPNKNNSLDVSTSDWTMQAWAKPSHVHWVNLVNVHNEGIEGTYDSRWGLLQANSIVACADNLPDGSFQHVMATRSGTTYKLYINGSLQSSLDPEGNYAMGSVCRIGAGAYDQFVGSIDEVRIEGVARSSNWVWACYMNMASNSFFNIPSPVQSFWLSAPIANLAPTSITTNSATLNAALSVPVTNYAVTVYWGVTNGGTNAGAWTYSASVGSWTNVALTNIAYPVSGLLAGTNYYYAFRATNATTNIWASPSWLFSTLKPNDILIWNVAGGGSWDTTTPNWTGASTNFTSDGTVDVIFSNAAGGTITVASNMWPASITVSGSGQYTFTGSPIAGGSLTKSGTSQLGFNTAPTNLSSMVVNGGTLYLNAANFVDGFAFTISNLTVNSGAQLEGERAVMSGNLIMNGGTWWDDNGFGGTLNSSVYLAADSYFGQSGGPTHVVNGPISGPGGLYAYPGGLYLNGSNSYAGATHLMSGGLVVSSFNSVSGGTATSSLGAPTNTTNGLIYLGSGTTSVNLYYTGTGETTDRNLQLAGTTGGASLIQQGTASGLPTTQAGQSGLLKFTGNFLIPGTAGVDNRKTLTLTSVENYTGPGYITGQGEISGSIGDSVLGTTGQRATSLTKSGLGIWTLSGTNNYTGTTLIQSGKLVCTRAEALGSGPLNISNNASQLELDFVGLRQVTSLTLNGTVQPNGTYGSSSSLATTKDNVHFAGLGAVMVGSLAAATTNTLSLTSGANPSSGGGALTFTATVTGGNAPSGNVVFYDGLTVLGSNTLNGAFQAAFTISTLTNGNHSLTALYFGNTSNAPSASTPLTQTVVETRPATTTALNRTAGTNPSSAGAVLTFVATVTGSTPTGTVVFYSGANVLGAVTLNGLAQASLTLTNLTSGWNGLMANYLGDANNAPSTTLSPLWQTVKPPAGNGKLKVFILAGQSNMQGKGEVENGRNPNDLYGSLIPGGLGSLRNMLNANTNQYGYLVDTNMLTSTTVPGWRTLTNVWVSYFTYDWVSSPLEVTNTVVRRAGYLDADFGNGASQGQIGPEYGFGLKVGSQLGDPVLIIKTAWGGTSLTTDWRPPSSGGAVGPCYATMIKSVTNTLANLNTTFTNFNYNATNGYEIAGFGWHQGWNDIGEPEAQYETNLVNLIHDVRAAFGVPNLPVAIGITGMGSADLNPDQLAICTAQAAVANPFLHPELAGTVFTVDTRPFDYGLLLGAIDQGYHWYHNAQSYFNVGESMGRGMIALLANPPGVSNLPGGVYTNSYSAALNALVDWPVSNCNVRAYWGTVNGGTNAAAWSNSIAVASWTNPPLTTYQYGLPGDYVLGGGALGSGVISNVNVTVAGLTVNTNYYYTFRATNNLQSLWATNVMSFFTVPMIVDFTASVTRGVAPLTVAFTDATTIGTPTTWAWDFQNDGATDSTLKNPTNTFSAGTYSVTLTVGNADGTRSLTKTNYITAIGLPAVDNAGGVTNQLASSATLQGRLTAGLTANAWICWDDHDGGATVTSAWASVQSVGAVTQGTVFSVPITGLATNKTYFYRCFATNEAGQAWSAAATSFSVAPVRNDLGYSMKISFTNYNRAETLTNFPVLVVLSNGMAGATFDFSTFLTTNGNDLRFTDSTGQTNLNYEIESWSVSSNAYVWVQVPQFYSNCSILAKWGAALQTNQPAYTTNGATWDSSFKGVWHFPCGASLTALDSTSNGNNGTVVSATAAAGVISGGMNVAAGQYIDLLNNNNSLDVSAGDWTMQAWAKPTASIHWVNLVNVHSYGIEGTYNLRWGLMQNDTIVACADSGPDGSFQHVMVTSSGTAYNLYINGSLQSSVDPEGAYALGGVCRIGQGPYGQFIGSIDEVRVEGVARSSNWVWACYQNMASNSFFNILSPVQSLSSVVANLAPGSITNNSARLNAALSARNTNYAVTVYWGTSDGGTNPGAWTNSASVGSWTNVAQTNLAYPASGLATGTKYYYAFRATNATTNVWATPSWQFFTLGGTGGGTPGKFKGVSVSGKTLGLVVTNGPPGGSWTLLQSTNLAQPISQWQTNCTGTYDGSGNLSTNIANTVTNRMGFYLLK